MSIEYLDQPFQRLKSIEYLVQPVLKIEMSIKCLGQPLQRLSLYQPFLKVEINKIFS
jgi:hypothetical protein